MSTETSPPPRNIGFWRPLKRTRVVGKPEFLPEILVNTENARDSWEPEVRVIFRPLVFCGLKAVIERKIIGDSGYV